MGFVTLIEQMRAIRVVYEEVVKWLSDLAEEGRDMT